MGEAKRKAKSLANRLLQPGAKCVFCGGVAFATSVDHVPHRSMFLGRRRPAGLEFPACRDCNNGSSDTDIVAALMSRISVDYGDSDDRGELSPLLKLAELRVPGLLGDIRPAISRRSRNIVDEGQSLHVLEIGALVREHLRAFGYKLLLALHHARTGLILENEGGVVAQVYTNADWITGSMPRALAEWTIQRRTLTQGTHNVGDQFYYDWVADDNCGLALYTAYFRKSFSIGGFVARDQSAAKDYRDDPEGVMLSPREIQQLLLKLRDDARLRRGWKAQTVRVGGAASGFLGHRFG